MSVKFIFVWYYFWIGWYWDRKKRRLYVMLIPCFGFLIHLHDYKDIGVPYVMQCKQCGQKEYFGP